MVAQITYSVLLTALWSTSVVESILYPQESETRERWTLDGIWNFKLSPDNQTGWQNADLSKTGPVIQMPVPASYNDITQLASIRDHVGIVWYDRRFYVPNGWREAKYSVWLRFSGVQYFATVWVNGNLVMSNQTGYLPFEAEVKKHLNFDSDNLITVVCNNKLTEDTVPQGRSWKVGGGNQNLIIGFSKLHYTTPGGLFSEKTNVLIVNPLEEWHLEINKNTFSRNNKHYKQSFNFDIFNYAGIHRSVLMYTTPNPYIDDISVRTIKQGIIDGIIIYNVTYKGSECPNPALCSSVVCLVDLIDRNNTLLKTLAKCSGRLDVPNAHFWWPFLMSRDPGYLYTLKVMLFAKPGALLDVYRQKIGIREISWNASAVSINNRPLYMRGIGMHEDSDIRGRGLDLAMIVKNFELIRWVGANSLHTLYYPFAEEVYDMADELGIVIINACPSVRTDIYGDALYLNHRDSLKRLINRDKNHPSVIMWSIANEPQGTHIPAVETYFENISKSVRNLDQTRPITISFGTDMSKDKVGKHVDVISINRYNGWYGETGDLSDIRTAIITGVRRTHNKYEKPILMSAYGADAVAGLHLYPEYPWSEDYQVELMSQHFRAFDKLLIYDRILVGEFISTFADYNAAQQRTSMGGNKGGIFTRERQPKASAHHLRQRYYMLANLYISVTMPEDLRNYVIRKNVIRDEL